MAPATSWKEVVQPGEADQLEKLGLRLRDLQRKRANDGPASRALHAKGWAGVEGQFEVLPDVPDYARVGIFAQAGTYRAYVRFSNGSSSKRHDRAPDVRGIALKLLGVPGKKIIPALTDATTQDFLLILSAATPFRNADEFVWFVFANQNQSTLLPKAIFRFGPWRALAILKRLIAGSSTPITSAATSRYFSALPTRFGPFAAKYSLAPHAAPEAGKEPGTSRDYLGDELATRLAAGPVVYDFCAQFFVDETKTPIEDSSVEWREAEAPFVKLARLTIPKQDLRSPRGQKLAAFVERLSFDPWHAPEEFRPLGNMMRARNAAYRLSTEERKAADEPDGSERYE